MPAQLHLPGDGKPLRSASAAASVALALASNSSAAHTRQRNTMARTLAAAHSSGHGFELDAQLVCPLTVVRDVAAGDAPESDVFLDAGGIGRAVAAKLRRVTCALSCKALQVRAFFTLGRIKGRDLHLQALARRASRRPAPQLVSEVAAERHEPDSNTPEHFFGTTVHLPRPSWRRALPSLSRSGFTGPLGKLDAVLPKIRISTDTLKVLRHKASEEGLAFSEYVRIRLDCVAFGVDHVATIAADRVRRVGANVGVNAPQPEGQGA